MWLSCHAHDAALHPQGVAASDHARDGTPEQPLHSPASGADLPWGFARGMPSLGELFAAAAAAAAAGGDPADRAEAASESSQARDNRSADRAHEGSPEPDEEAGGRRSLYMRRLQDSRAFHCPDATECMADALGAKDALQSLQVGG